jgi:hypothetical protein
MVNTAPVKWPVQDTVNHLGKGGSYCESYTYAVVSLSSTIINDSSHIHDTIIDP